MKKTTVVHRRYSDREDRPDLCELALCNNINGAICGTENLTADKKAVTCGRCKRIMDPECNAKSPPTRAFSSADLRRNSRMIAGPRKLKALVSCENCGEELDCCTSCNDAHEPRSDRGE